MTSISDIIRVIDAYLAGMDSKGTPLKEKTLSGRMFDDQKTISNLRAGGDMYVSRANNALIWLSRNWEDHMVWPEGAERPVVEEDA